LTESSKDNVAPRSKSNVDALRSLGALSTVGFAFVIAVCLGTALGYLIDRWLDTSPVFFLLGFAIGVIAGIRSVLRTVASASKHDG
jgi:F0F1-type ATP synthase assembly protein I